MTRLASARRQIVRAAMAAPYLDREEEQALAARWRAHGDEAALHRLTAAHMRLVLAVAARFRHFGLPMNDLVQEGHVGLLEAARRFEPEREVRFSTYATWWVRAAIQDHVLRNWSIVRGGSSSTQKALFFSLRRLRARLAREGVVAESDMRRRIAAMLGISEEDVAVMEARLAGPDISLNAPLGDADQSPAPERQDFLLCDKPLPDEAAGQTIDAERRVRWLRAALSVLSERELDILRARRLADEGVTLEALGRRLGVSKERVRQIESHALEKLRSALLRLSPEEAFV